MANDLSRPEPANVPAKLVTTCELCLAGPEELSRRIIEVFDERNYEHPVVMHMATNCHTAQDYLKASSRKELVDEHHKLTKLYPDYRIKVTNSTGEIDEEKGRAKIWLSLEVTGYPVNVRREGISLLYWRISNGEWIHYRNRGLTHGGGGD